jgi:hypothetical protein
MSFQVNARLCKLNRALEKTVTACHSIASYSLFKKHFTAHGNIDNAVLKQIHSQFQENFLGMMKAEIKLMMDEENIEEKLLSLDNLAKSQPTKSEPMTSGSTTTVWRPTGHATEDVSAHLMHGLMTMHNKLTSTVRELEAEADRVGRLLVERRQLITSLQTEACVSDEQLMEMTSNLSQSVNTDL